MEATVDNLPCNAAEYRAWWESQTDVPYGYCCCGCGQPTPLAKRSDWNKKRRKGAPVRYINGHNRRLSPIDYLEVDRGYDTPCWIWQHHINRGYGKTNIKRAGRMRSESAHKAYYEDRYGVVPKGMELDHLCRVRSCVNPTHLEPVSHAENMRRGAVAKLTHAQVEQIRRIREEAELPVPRIAKAFGVAPHAIYRILSGQSWS